MTEQSTRAWANSLDAKRRGSRDGHSVEKKTIDRTSAGLRDALFDAIEKVRDGDMLAEDAKAVAHLADKICKTVELEIEVAKLRSDPKLQQPVEPVPLMLGAPQEKQS